MSQSDRLLYTIPELGAFELSGVLGLDTAERPSAIECFIIDLASRAPEQDMTASR